MTVKRFWLGHCCVVLVKADRIELLQGRCHC